MKTQALVLSALSYGDRQLIVDLFSREAGRQSFIVQLAAGRKGKMRKMLFQPLMLLDVDFTQRPTRTLQRFSEVSISRPWLTLCADPIKIQLVFFVAELLRYATRDEQQPQALFDYVAESLQWLDKADDGYANFHLVFMIRLTLFLGFFPNIETYHDGSCFDLRSGCFSMEIPAHADFIRGDEAEQMINLMRLNYSTMHLFRMTRQQRSRCVDVILEYYSLHIPDFPKMKTLEVLREAQ
jgi:DNA repair protein RecO (recombination protein O)